MGGINEESLRNLPLEDLICTVYTAKRESQRLWWRVLIENGEHPENQIKTRRPFPGWTTRAKAYQAHQEDLLVILAELKFRGIDEEDL